MTKYYIVQMNEKKMFINLIVSNAKDFALFENTLYEFLGTIFYI